MVTTSEPEDASEEAASEDDASAEEAGAEDASEGLLPQPASREDASANDRISAANFFIFITPNKIGMDSVH